MFNTWHTRVLFMEDPLIEIVISTYAYKNIWQYAGYLRAVEYLNYEGRSFQLVFRWF